MPLDLTDQTDVSKLTNDSSPVDTKMMLNDVANDFDGNNNDVHENADKHEKDIIYNLVDIPKIPSDVDKAYIKVRIPVKTLKEYYRNCMSFSDSALWFLNHCLTELIKEYNLRYYLEGNIGELVFDGREPRHDVLEKLAYIVDALSENHPIAFVPKLAVKDTVKRVLKNADSRTIDKYRKCILDYAKSAKDDPSPFHANLRTLSTVIYEKLNQ